MKCNHVKLFTDGGSRGNPGKSAIGILITDKSGETLKEHAQGIPNGTNNNAEYEALIMGLELCKEIVPKGGRVECFSDSELVINQMRRAWKVKDEDIKILHKRAVIADLHFGESSYTHVPRTYRFIQRADQLLNAVMDGVKV